MEKGGRKEEKKSKERKRGEGSLQTKGAWRKTEEEGGGSLFGTIKWTRDPPPPPPRFREEEWGSIFVSIFPLSSKSYGRSEKKVGKWDRVERRRSFLFRLRPSVRGGSSSSSPPPLLLFLLSRERGADPASEEREGNPVGQLAKLSFARHTTRMGLGVLEKIPMLCNILCRAQILSWLLNA